jgi:hypothetical protein
MPLRDPNEMDVERLNNYFLTRPLLSGADEFVVSRPNNVPEFSFATVSESKICDAGMSIRSDAAGVDGIPLSFIKLLSSSTCADPHIFDHIFVSFEFPGKWKTSMVFPIPKVSSLAKFSDYRPISLLVCFSKVFEVLMARQMERHIRCNNLLTVFQFGFRRHHSTTAAMLKAFDMVVHGLLLCKLQIGQNYSVGAGMLVGSYLGERAQFVRFGGQESSVGAVTCGVLQGSVLGPLLFI